MAEQDGIIPLKGTIDKLTFFKSQDGYRARKKTSVTKDKMTNNPNYDSVRETMDMFSRAGGAGKLLRLALRPISQGASDGRMISRLSKKMTQVIKADATNPRGKKNVLDGELELLTGFEFNVKNSLTTTMAVIYESVIDRVSGNVQVNVPAFVPKNQIAYPAQATHFQLNMAGAEIDFEKGTYLPRFKSSDQLPLSDTELAAFSLSVTLTPNSTHPLFLALGINFFAEDIGSNKLIKNKDSSALAIIKVSGV